MTACWTVLVTGAARGFGKAVLSVFAAQLHARGVTGELASMASAAWRAEALAGASTIFLAPPRTLDFTYLPCLSAWRQLEAGIFRDRK